MPYPEPPGRPEWSDEHHEFTVEEIKKFEDRLFENQPPNFKMISTASPFTHVPTEPQRKITWRWRFRAWLANEILKLEEWVYPE